MSFFFSLSLSLTSFLSFVGSFSFFSFFSLSFFSFFFLSSSAALSFGIVSDVTAHVNKIQRSRTCACVPGVQLCKHRATLCGYAAAERDATFNAGRLPARFNEVMHSAVVMETKSLGLNIVATVSSPQLLCPSEATVMEEGGDGNVLRTCDRRRAEGLMAPLAILDHRTLIKNVR